MNGRPWTTYDREFIRLTYGRVRAARIAEHLGRSLTTVYSVARNAGLMKPRKHKPRPWTAYETEFLRLTYPDVHTALIAEHLDRNISQVYKHADGMGLKKSERFMASPASGRNNCRKGINTRFRPGQTPWNKGNKGYDPGGRSAETRFKPGDKPHTWVPIGTVAVHKGGYLKKKIRDDAPPGMARKNWEFVHVLHWQRYRGPVPPGHKLRFRNGDIRDIRIANLELVSNAEHARRNCATRWSRPRWLNLAIAAKARLTREINQREKRRNERSQEQVRGSA